MGCKNGKCVDLNDYEDYNKGFFFKAMLRLVNAFASLFLWAWVFMLFLIPVAVITLLLRWIF